jgi:hypothetical protein
MNERAFALLHIGSDRQQLLSSLPRLAGEGERGSFVKRRVGADLSGPREVQPTQRGPARPAAR